ncbi:MAG: hypothetical protein QF489_08880 [Planctomycetota bacterium]|nr:hypothetical protein [Planctomycetota bacterium]
MIRLFLNFALLGCLALSCSGADLPEGEGLVFYETIADVGELWSGEVRELEFPFQVVDSPVQIASALPTCACLKLQMEVEGQTYVYGKEIAVGQKGVLKVTYDSTGFHGRKFTDVLFKGVGKGLKQKIEVRSWLRSWFELSPKTVDFGQIDGEMEQLRKITVRGQAPFKITEILSQAPPMEVRGVPSATSSKEQVIEIVVPKTTAEGRHVGFFNFATDHQGYSFRLGAAYQVAGALWTMPDKRLLLGELAAGVEHFSVIEVGARKGTLEMPEVRAEGLPGASLKVEKLGSEGRYRVHLGLLPESTKISGELLLSLPYTVEDKKQVVERRIQVFGVVRKP